MLAVQHLMILDLLLSKEWIRKEQSVSDLENLNKPKKNPPENKPKGLHPFGTG